MVKVWHDEQGLWERHEDGAEDGGWTPFPWHCHARHQFNHSAECALECRLRGRTLRVPAGALLFLPAGTPHAASEPADAPARVTWRLLYLDPATWPDAPSVAGEAWVERVLAEPELGARFARWHVAEETGRAERARLRAELLAALTAIAADLPRRRTAPRVDAACAVMHARLAEPLTTTAVAAAVGWDRHRLQRAFREELGLSPHRYLVQARLDAARAGLARGRAPAEVAQAAGFADQSHFTRHFRRAVQTTPGRYRARA